VLWLIFVEWPKDIHGAWSVQEKLRERVKITPLKKAPSLVAGVDAAFLDNKAIASACLYSYPSVEVVDTAFEEKKLTFPYIPGFLTFREGPAIVSALKKLKKRPDILLVDGQGIAHPRGIGIASHLGVILDMPSIGCAKSRLVGEYAEPDSEKGDWSYLWYNDRIVGAVLRTRSGVRPLFVSPGHRIDLTGSITIVLNCARKYRIPEPLRKADILSRKLKYR
jgi:deoxyribonuclease V